MSRLSKLLSDRQLRFPRVSGDEPPTGLIDWWEEAFSPRERG